MADNTTLNSMTGGDAIAADDISSVKYQRIKLIHGADGVNAGDVATGNPLPVVQTGALPAGDNNVGNVDIASIAAGDNNIGNVDVATQPARAATTDTITAKIATDTIQNGTTALTPKFVAIAASSSGNNTVLAAVTSKKIRVLALNLIANAAVNAKWQSGAGGTDLTGLAYLAANGGYILPFNPVGWFETASNTLLNLNLSGAVAVGGHLTYVEV